jgi:hypothetical protein
MATGMITQQTNDILQPMITMCQAPKGTGQTLINLNELAAALTAVQATVTALIALATANP